MTTDPIETLAPREAYALWAASYPPYAHNPLMLAEERALLSLLPTRLEGLCVLDAGCGSGRYLRHARRRGATTLVGSDLSREMLLRAEDELLIQADLTQLPLPDGWADLSICGLTIGHLSDPTGGLRELRRVTRSGSLILLSDFHPDGAARGWRREFTANGRRYGIRHTSVGFAVWKRQCDELGLEVLQVCEPHLDPADIPSGVRFDRAALQIPVALVLALRVV